MAPKLEQVLTIRAYLSKESTLNLGPIKSGAHRVIVPVTSGFVKGPGIDLQVLPGGGDWLLVDHNSGVAHLDIRFQAGNSSGDLLYGHYPGIIKLDAEVLKFLQFSPGARTTESKDQYFITTPVFEVSCERLKWLEQNVFLGHGRFVVDEDGGRAVEYELYKVDSA